MIKPMPGPEERLHEVSPGRIQRLEREWMESAPLWETDPYEHTWLENTSDEIIPNWYTMFPEPAPFIPRPKTEEHKEWVKSWKRHYKVAMKSKFWVRKKPNKRKMERKKKKQLETIKKWLESRPVVVVLDEGSGPDEHWWNSCCDDIACEGECGQITKDHTEATYPL
ncbi:hypothetical protein A2U01_0036708 [Trifolium medium]|uniref:Uncharacterized protein n=1 Tax=Trifolium medium TaxID=97028 RepID=A0A392PVU8_9FABA|nr:hypothetical protein [Trifolium medium]